VTGSGPHCVSCLVPLPANAKFCGECGGKPSTTGVSTGKYGSQQSEGTSGDKEIPGVSTTRPNCKGCKKPLGGYFITALGGKWHEECFVCSQCSKKITETSFAVKGDKAVCNSCQVQEYKGLDVTANTGSVECAGCHKSITSISVNFQDEYYHPECLKCAMCWKPIDTAKGFLTSGGKPFHPECAKKMDPEAGGILLCEGCKEEITGSYVKPGGRSFHSGCFKCAWCGASLPKGYIERDGACVCGDCAKKKPLTTPGVPTSSSGKSPTKQNIPMPTSAKEQKIGPGQSKCTRCLTVIPASAAFCPECGKKPESTTTTSQSTSTPTPTTGTTTSRFCPECGTNVGTAKFCGECGYKF